MIEFSNRISSLKPSAIREILKTSNDPDLISLSAGNPDPKSFPVEEMGEIAAEIFSTRAASALQYGISEGYEPLRRLTCERISKKYNIGRDSDDLIITSGGQQAIEMTAKVLINEGDTVICEAPSFVGALNAFRSYGANLVGVDVDENGMKMDELEKALSENKNAKIIYTIPTFQNPSGTTMPLERRKTLLELAEKYDVMVLEDSPYFELRFAGEEVPPVKSLDTTGRVIYSGSYSKILSPGIRVGFVCADAGLISKLTVAKQVSDVHTNLFFQILVAEYLEKFNIDLHISKIREIYKEKASAMLSAMDNSFNGLAEYTRPDGGLFIWCTMKDGLDGSELCRIAKERKVSAVPGCAFSVDESAVVPTFRLNFSLPSVEQINTGIERLAGALAHYVR